MGMMAGTAGGNTGIEQGLKLTHARAIKQASFVGAGNQTVVIGNVPANKKWRLYGIYLNTALYAAPGNVLVRNSLDIDNTGAHDYINEIDVGATAAFPNAVIAVTVPLQGYIEVGSSHEIAMFVQYTGAISLGCIIDIWYEEVPA